MTISKPIQIKPDLYANDEIQSTKNQQKEDLWENPLPATKAMKKAIQQVKNKFNIDEVWDGDFYL
jgi:uncharacterized membrane protein YkoI